MRMVVIGIWWLRMVARGWCERLAFPSRAWMPQTGMGHRDSWSLVPPIKIVEAGYELSCSRLTVSKAGRHMLRPERSQAWSSDLLAILENTRGIVGSH